MKAVILTSDRSSQRALATKLAQVCDVTAIVLSKNVPKRKKPPLERARLLGTSVAARSVGYPLVRAWQRMLKRYEAAYPAFPTSRLVRVRNVNDPASVETIASLSPDVVIVSGTNLVGKGILKAAAGSRGVLNLHTGISPYVKGGPNCTNWCLADGLFHLIGSTVMWLDLGIDTGDIIATERAPLHFGESLDDLHWKVMEHAHDLYVRVVRGMAEGRDLARVPQGDIAVGRTYYSLEWTARPIARALFKYARSWSPELKNDANFLRAWADTRLVPPPIPPATE